MALACIVSDTHDNQDAIDAIVRVASERGADMIIHAGDWIAPFSLVRLAKFKGRIVGVYGNNDGERELLAEKARECGVELLGDFGEIEYSGLRIAILHGTHSRMVEALLLSGLYDVVVTGHTHKPEVRRAGRSMLINPGEACGYLTGKRTIALLNVERMEVEILEI